MPKPKFSMVLEAKEDSGKRARYIAPTPIKSINIAQDGFAEVHTESGHTYRYQLIPGTVLQLMRGVRLRVL